MNGNFAAKMVEIEAKGWKMSGHSTKDGKFTKNSLYCKTILCFMEKYQRIIKGSYNVHLIKAFGGFPQPHFCSYQELLVLS